LAKETGLSQNRAYCNKTDLLQENKPVAGKTQANFKKTYAYCRKTGSLQENGPISGKRAPCRKKQARACLMRTIMPL
jgi:hypothetical protein